MFDTIEGQLGITISGDGKGHFAACVTAMDVSGIGNQITARFTFDQTELAATLRALDAICARLDVSRA